MIFLYELTCKRERFSYYNSVDVTAVSREADLNQDIDPAMVLLTTLTGKRKNMLWKDSFFLFL